MAKKRDWRSERVSISVTPGRRKQIDEAAQALGMRPSALCGWIVETTLDQRDAAEKALKSAMDALNQARRLDEPEVVKRAPRAGQGPKRTRKTGKAGGAQ